MTSSKRVRDAPDRYMDSSFNPSKKSRGEFSVAEDAQLYAALLSHGPTDIAKLTRSVPTRNDYQIKHRIAELQKKAQQSLTMIKRECNGRVVYEARDKVALDRWLEHLDHLQEKAKLVNSAQEELPVRMIGQCLSYIAEYEEHPEPGKCGGVNMQNVYEFLVNMMSGLPPKLLRPVDAKFVLDALSRLSHTLDVADIGKESSLILTGRPEWRSKGKRPHTYGVNLHNLPEDKLLIFLDSAKYNPFKVPKEWLKRNF